MKNPPEDQQKRISSNLSDLGWSTQEANSSLHREKENTDAPTDEGVEEEVLTEGLRLVLSSFWSNSSDRSLNSTGQMSSISFNYSMSSLLSVDEEEESDEIEPFSCAGMSGSSASSPTRHSASSRSRKSREIFRNESPDGSVSSNKSAFQNESFRSSSSDNQSVSSASTMSESNSLAFLSPCKAPTYPDAALSKYSGGSVRPASTRVKAKQQREASHPASQPLTLTPPASASEQQLLQTRRNWLMNVNLFPSYHPVPHNKEARRTATIKAEAHKARRRSLKEMPKVGLEALMEEGSVCEDTEETTSHQQQNFPVTAVEFEIKSKGDEEEGNDCTSFLASRCCRLFLITALCLLLGLIVIVMLLLATGQIDVYGRMRTGGRNYVEEKDPSQVKEYGLPSGSSNPDLSQGASFSFDFQGEDLFANPDTPLEFRLYKALPSYSLVTLLDNPESPQALAYEWIINYPEDDSTSLNLPDWRIRQLFALVTFYYSFAGEDWPTAKKKHWLSYEVPECQWDGSSMGMDCNDNGTVSNLNFEGLDVPGAVINLGGSCMPPELEFLTSLETLSIQNCRIDANMEEMIPTQFARLTSLKRLSFRYNGLKGTLPAHLGRTLQSLEYFSVGSNFITGTIPTQLGDLDNLQGLMLYGNQLSGKLPSELGNLQQLSGLSVIRNELSGTIPPQWTNANLEWLYLDQNSFVGQVPAQVCQLPSLKEVLVDCTIDCGLDCGGLCSCHE